jgi:hypothetical protein
MFLTMLVEAKLCENKKINWKIFYFKKPFFLILILKKRKKKKESEDIVRILSHCTSSNKSLCSNQRIFNNHVYFSPSLSPRKPTNPCCKKACEYLKIFQLINKILYLNCHLGKDGKTKPEWMIPTQARKGWMVDEHEMLSIHWVPVP